MRIARLTDYGVLLLARLAQAAPSTLSARELAAASGLPLPTVSKVLKRLSQAALLTPHRGSRGGYQLARQASHVTLAQVLRALEGPLALTECAAPGACELEPSCPSRGGWGEVSRIVQRALDAVTLEDVLSAAGEAR